MIDINITKVNVEQINNLINKLNSISKTISTNIQAYRSNLSTIEQAGYLRGISEEVIHISCDKISLICSEFDEYATKLAKELNEVVSKTQQIETEEKGNIEEILSQDPTTFNGTISGTSVGGASSNVSTGAVTAGAAVTTGAALSSGTSSSKNLAQTGATSSATSNISSSPSKASPTVLANYSSPYSDTNVKNEKEVYAYLTEDMGLNDAAAAGVMANIYAESRFNPGTSGDSGTSYGMFQVHAGRKDNLMTWCAKKGYDPSSVQGQMARFEEEVTKVYSKTETALYNASDSVAGARNAASVMTIDYEKPSNASSKAAYRANLAEQYYKQIKAAKK